MSQSAFENVIGLTFVVHLAILSSFCGYVVTWPLLRYATQPPFRLHASMFDACCLLVIVGTLSRLTWISFHEAPTASAMTFVACVTCVAVTWWLVIATAMSRIGIASWVARGIYQLLVVPCGFVAPFFILINVMTVVGNQQVRPPIPADGEFIQIVIGVVAFFACVPLTKWVVNRPSGSRVLR